MSPSAGSGSQAQVGRLLAMLPYLQAHPGVRLEQVAGAFAVTERQVVSDLKVLWFCGLPGLSMGDLIEVDMDAVQGSGTVTVTNADYLSRPLRLDAAEAAALVVAVRALRETVAEADRDAVNRVLAKLAGVVEAVPAAGSRTGPRLGGRGPAGQGSAEQGPGGQGPGGQGSDATAAEAVPVEVNLEPDADEAVLAAVREGLSGRRRLHLTYAGATSDEVTERDVDPRQLVTAGGRTYLDAWCHRTEGNRLFLLGRIQAAAVLDVAADPPPNAADDRSGAASAFRPSTDDPVATIRLSPAARWVSEYYPVESAEALPDGGQLVRMRVADPRFLRRLALRLGADGRVVDPPELAADVAAAAAAALAAY